MWQEQLVDYGTAALRLRHELRSACVSKAAERVVIVRLCQFAAADKQGF